MATFDSLLNDLAKNIANLQIEQNDNVVFSRKIRGRVEQQPTFQTWDVDFEIFSKIVGSNRNVMSHRKVTEEANLPKEAGCYELNEIFEELTPKRPPRSYICNICYKTGHYIQYCPKAPNNTLTPYQGHKRCFGEFICPKCKRSWKSSKSFAEIGQECKKCKVTVFPKKQYPLANKINKKDFDSTNCSMSTSMSSCESFGSC